MQLPDAVSNVLDAGGIPWSPAELAAAPERCLATVVITAGRSAGVEPDGMAIARATKLGARGIARLSDAWEDRRYFETMARSIQIAFS